MNLSEAPQPIETLALRVWGSSLGIHGVALGLGFGVEIFTGLGFRVRFGAWYGRFKAYSISGLKFRAFFAGGFTVLITLITLNLQP